MLCTTTHGIYLDLLRALIARQRALRGAVLEVVIGGLSALGRSQTDKAQRMVDVAVELVRTGCGYPRCSALKSFLAPLLRDRLKLFRGGIANDLLIQRLSLRAACRAGSLCRCCARWRRGRAPPTRPSSATL